MFGLFFCWSCFLEGWKREEGVRRSLGWCCFGGERQRGLVGFAGAGYDVGWICLCMSNFW